ncbi:trimethylamine methyltransferase family protein [Desulfosarcina sp.]|uniref:trimethylamine methyltransferase family protein n=1 Tax=Desulfosarcina sp. TaxID=2027861 RepID=UPI003970DC6E
MQRFEYFTDDDVHKIHEATLRVLETVGVDFGYPPAIEVFKQAGCKVDGERVFFSPRMVMEQVAKAPSEYTLQARNPEKNVAIGGDNIAYIPCYGPPFVHDLDRGRRESTLEDYTNFVKLSHASRSIDITGGMMAEPNDIPHPRRNAEMMLASMRYSDKPFMGGAIGAEAARETIEMAAIVFGCSQKDLAAKMPMISILCTRTPLAYDDRMLGAIMVYAKAGMPQLISSLSIAGATSPVTMEGTLVVQNAEVLAGIVLTQLICEGTPVVFSGSSSAAAMRYGTLSIGAPEMAVNTAATAQMARFYGIPSRGGGAITDSKLPDAQAGMESMMSQLMATLSGVHFVLHSAGILEGYMTASYEKFIIDDEICGMCKRIKRGENADPQKLALDVIAQVGPGGEYLTHMHTFQNFRKEFYTPIMEQKESYAGWKAKGGESMERVANRKWKQILESYQEPSLPAEALGELAKYIEKKYGK